MNIILTKHMKCHNPDCNWVGKQHELKPRNAGPGKRGCPKCDNIYVYSLSEQELKMEINNG